MPTLKEVITVRKEINELFSINKNSQGYYNTPLQKIEFACKKFIQVEGEPRNNIFFLKLAGDGTSITKSNVKILNFAFTIINDYKKTKGVEGQYSLGRNLFIILNFFSSQNLPT